MLIVPVWREIRVQCTIVNPSVSILFFILNSKWRHWKFCSENSSHFLNKLQKWECVQNIVLCSEKHLLRQDNAGTVYYINTCRHFLSWPWIWPWLSLWTWHYIWPCPWVQLEFRTLKHKCVHGTRTCILILNTLWSFKCRVLKHEFNCGILVLNTSMKKF